MRSYLCQFQPKRPGCLLISRSRYSPNCQRKAAILCCPVMVRTMTHRTLERKFQASLGRTIAEEITRLRLERAKRRLVETEAPLKEIVMNSGFRTANHFTKVFSRVEGISPPQYREKRQQPL